MEQNIYVDVLLVTNYIVNMLLIICTGKLSGRSLKRSRIVAAALFGASTSLTIFLPFIGFAVSILSKLSISAAIVLIAFKYVNVRIFLKQIFLFFAVSFSFAGVMLGIWMTFTPRGMLYYNGIIYFDVSSLLLIITTVIAYILLILAERFVKGNKLTYELYTVSISINRKSFSLSGILDTGNHLREPFSNTPVIICFIEEIAELLPRQLVASVMEDKIFSHNIYNHGITVRLVPYSNVGGSGVLPAVKADFITIKQHSQTLRIEQVYIGLSNKKIGDERYTCLLNPDLVGMDINKNMITVVPRK